MLLKPRQIVNKIVPWLKQPDIIVLLGARQVGKTYIMKLLMKEMEETEFVYYDLEDTYNIEILSSLDSFLNNLKARGFEKNKRINVFIDEVQYLPNPSNFLKLIRDHHQNIKLIVSGSSALDIRKKFTDELTGRKVVFEIYPLNFSEYLHFKDSELEEIKQNLNIKNIIKNFSTAKKYYTFTPKVVPVFEEFIIFGGYPLPTLTANVEDRLLRLKDIHNTYIQKDIKDIAGIDNILQFNRLISFLSVQISNLANLNEICKETAIKRRDLEKYITILEKTFILNLVKPFHMNRQKELTKMPKIFFSDTGLRNLNINDMRSLNIRPDKGALAENVFHQELIKQKATLEEVYFWRTKEKLEVDFIIVENRQLIPTEVKYQTMRSQDMPGPLRSFILKYRPKKAVVITKDYLSRTKLQRTEILFIPLWMT